MKQPSSEYFFSGAKVRLLPVRRPSEIGHGRSHHVRVESIKEIRSPQGRTSPLIDKEQLVEDLQTMKRLFHDQQSIIKHLKTSNSYLKSELLRVQNSLISIDPTNHSLLSNNRSNSEQLSKIQTLIKITARDPDPSRYDIKPRAVEELESKLNQLDKQNQDLTFKLQRSLLIGEQESILKRDNIEMAQLIQQQQGVIQELQDKVNYQAKKITQTQIKLKGLKLLQEKQFQELTQLKERDTLFQEHQSSRYQKEKLLKDSLEQLQQEMNSTNEALVASQQKVALLEKKLRDSIQESADQQKVMELEIIRLRNTITNLKEELETEKAQNKAKRSSMRMSTYLSPDDQPSFLKSPTYNNRRQSQLDSINEEQRYYQRQGKPPTIIIRGVDKIKVKQVAQYVKYKLMSQRIDLKEVDQFLTASEGSESKDTVSFNDLRQSLCHNVFGIEDEHQVTILAQYLTDCDEGQTTVSAARLKSMFRRLMDNYTIPSPQELPEIESSIQSFITAKKDQLLKYVNSKNKTQSNRLPLDDLIEAMKVHEAPFNQTHYNHIKAYLMRTQNTIEWFEEKDLDELFTIPIEEKSPFDSAPNLDKPLIIQSQCEEEEVFKFVDTSEVE